MAGDSPLPSPGGPPKRPRAPTITIDTSAVSSTSPPQSMEKDAVPLRALPNSPSLSQGEASSPTNAHWSGSSETPHHSGASHRSQNSRGSIPDVRAFSSFDEGDSSRPQSPHNVSSPTARTPGAQNFLAVPGTAGRSRQNSVDSEDGHQSGSSMMGDTTIAGSSTQGDDRKASFSTTKNEEILHDSEALKPDPGTDADFERENNKFAYTPGLLNKMLNPKSLSAFYALGGLSGLEKGLRTDRKSGLSADESILEGNISFDEVRQGSSTIEHTGKGPKVLETAVSSTESHNHSSSGREEFSDRKRIFEDNRLPVKKGKSLLEIMWITYNDKVLILLTAAAIISLAVGLYQTFGTQHENGQPKVEWVEGVAIILAIVVVVVVGSLNDYQKERQFVKLNKKKQDRNVNVTRSGKVQEISVYDVLVGDVCHLEPGDMIPCDGIFIEGHNVKCDESSATGESDLIRKRPADDVYSAIEKGEDCRKMDPFILSGAQVTDGVGTFLVTSTGVNSSHGKIMMSLREDPEVTPLQSKLNTLAEYIAKLGGAAGLLLFVVLFIKFLVGLKGSTLTPAEKGQEFLSIFIVTVTIIVVAVPEGLPLAVTLALAFATTRMLKDNNLVRHLKACEVMGNATAICSDKTGTLTQNKMKVVAGTFGTSSRFGGTTTPEDDDDNFKGKAVRIPKVVDDIPAQEVVKSLDKDTVDLITQSIVINSTAFEGEADGEQTFVGSKTETALLIFARDHLGMGPVGQERSNADVVQLIPFDSKRKCMGVVVKLDSGKYRLYVKGASEILLEQCTQVISEPTRGVDGANMTDDNRKTLNGLITSYAERSLRTIGLVYRDFPQWPPKHARRGEGDSSEAVFEDVFKQMVLLGIVGIQDPLRDGVQDAVKTCQKAGVVVRMVTGDNLMTARAIAGDCGIYTAGGVIMEGPAFRKLSKKEMQQVIPSLQVLARSSPEDKRILVKRLKELGETVAVTGDGTNDAPALKTADIGFSMGIAGTEVAKEASAIILMDDNFASIVKAMMWGRAVNDAVKKFLQFQVTVNITAVLLTFISAVASDSESSVLTAVQLLWVNLIMDTMAALALATDPPTPSILNRKPDPKSASLISVTMWKMIFGQAIYQLVVTLVLYFAGTSIMNYNVGRDDPTSLLPTLVFNTFVWMQIFNAWNNRRLDNHFNIFEGILNNWFFIAINLIMIGGQTVIVVVGGIAPNSIGAAFSVNQIGGTEWAISVVIGFLSIPIGAAIRLIPDELVLRMIPNYIKNYSSKKPKFTVQDEEQQFYFPAPLQEVKEELSFMRKFKGGRLNNLKFAMAHPVEAVMHTRSRSGSRSGSLPQTPTEGVSRENSTRDVNRDEAPRTPESARRSRDRRSRSNSALGATAVMAGIIAGSVAGWSPIDRREGENDSIRFSRSRGRNELEHMDGVEVHPQTEPNATVIVEEPRSIEGPPSQVDDITPAVKAAETK